MAVNLRELIPAVQVAATATTYYTATNCVARFDSFTLTNTDTVAQTVTVHVVPLAGSASATNMIISAKSLAPGECYTCPEMVGKSIKAGTFVQALASTAGKVTFHASGIEVT